MDSVTLEVLQPTGLDVAEMESPAGRIDTLEGKRIGLVWNNKDYGDKLLDQVEEMLRGKYTTAKFSRWRLAGCSTLPPEGELEGIAREVDAVVYALGD